MKIGLVLNGGGGKGAYQVGVMKALYELGLEKDIKAIAGTSVGALNGALFLNGCIEVAEHIWETISPDKILTLKAQDQIDKLLKLGVKLTAPLVANLAKLEGYGIFSRTGMQEIIQENINLNTLSNKVTPLYMTCVTWPTMHKKYFKINGLQAEKIEKVLLATSAIPAVFSPIEIEGVRYVDGGLRDNSPIQPVYDEGCDVIIVIALNRTDTIEAQYPKAKIIQLLPNEPLGNFVSGTLDFKPEHAKRRIAEGYTDAMDIIGKAMKVMAREQHLFESLQILTVENRAFQHQQANSTKQFDAELASLYKQLENGRG